MKILSNKTMKEIKSRYDKWGTDKRIIEAGKNDKKRTVGVLMKEIDYLFDKLGFTGEEE